MSLMNKRWVVSPVRVENDGRKVQLAGVRRDLVSRNSGGSQAEKRTQDKERRLTILRIMPQGMFGLHSGRMGHPEVISLHDAVEVSTGKRASSVNFRMASLVNSLSMPTETALCERRHRDEI